MNKYSNVGLTDDDLELVHDYVDYYCADEAQGYFSMGCPIQQYLSEWYKAKSEYLFKMFGNKLIIKEPISFSTPKTKIEKEMDAMIEDMEDFFLPQIRHLLEGALLDGANYRYHEQQLQHPQEFEFITQIMWIFTKLDVFTNNEYCGENIRYHNNEILSKPFTISNGQKPFRAINNLVKTFGPLARQNMPETYNDSFFEDLQTGIEKYRVRQSQILNCSTISGNLCLSIHPMDYITASDNNYGWDSCMTWTREGSSGEYRLGTVEMMNSPMVIVAYIEGSAPYYPLDGRQWSNKKWREFFIVHRDIISGIRGYPYVAEEVEDIVLGKLAAMAQTIGWPSYEEPRSDLRKTTCIYFHTKAMYNDTSYHPVRFRTSTEPTRSIDHEEPVLYCINYSGIPLCAECGEPITRRDEEAYKLNCEVCEGGTRCDCCHELIDEGDDIFDIGDGIACGTCASQCAICEDYHLSRDMTTVFASIKHRTKNQTYHAWVSVDEDCFKKIKPYLYFCKKNSPASYLDDYRQGWNVTSEMPGHYAEKIIAKVIEYVCFERQDPLDYEIYEGWHDQSAKNSLT